MAVDHALNWSHPVQHVVLVGLAGLSRGQGSMEENSKQEEPISHASSMLEGWHFGQITKVIRVFEMIKTAPAELASRLNHASNRIEFPSILCPRFALPQASSTASPR
jgi:hypothetical protein